MSPETAVDRIEQLFATRGQTDAAVDDLLDGDAMLVPLALERADEIEKTAQCGEAGVRGCGDTVNR